MQRRLICLFAASGFLWTASAASAEETVTIGNAATIVRTVVGLLDADVRQLKLADDVYHNEIIETKEGSATELVFLDETKLALGPNSKLTLDRFVFDPQPDRSSFVATATKGVFQFVTGNLPKNAYTIHTPTATIGVRGTIFELTVSPRSQDGRDAFVELVLEEGAADIVTCDGQHVSLEQGGAVVVTQIAADDCAPTRILE